ncbi:MAG TPA: murein biosynthesis integral membrane protein MurJ [Caulobacteraceae bacterium]|nr:murein biosynthesis integral membrane protein MurJ [Caulobacteraceae bacterium]
MSDPTAPSPPARSAEPSTRRAAGIVGVAVIVSRLLGLIREQVFAAMFGAGKLLDVYLAAFQIPNLLRDLFAEGALSVAFTTLFTKSWEEDGEASAWEFAQLILTAMIILMGLVSVAGVVGSPLLVEVTNFGFHHVPGKFELAVRMTRILFPFILFVSLAAAVMGMLNARGRFAVPASASSVFNLVSVIAGVGLAFAFDAGARAHPLHPHFTVNALYGVTMGVLLGGVAQLGMQLPSLWRLGFTFRWRPALSDPRLKALWALMWPSVVAGAAVQVNVLVNGMFASGINGGRSWLACAFRLMQLPIGLFGVSLATVTLPSVARAFSRGDTAAFGATAKDSLRLAFFLTLPAAAGLAALAHPIIEVIYQHGAFSARDTSMTAFALQAYALGLAGYAAIKVLVPCFYALGLPKTPLRISLIGIGINLALNLFNYDVLHLGHVGLAVTTSAVALINFAQLLFALKRRIDLGTTAQWAGYLGRCILAAAICGGAAFALWSALDPRAHGLGLRMGALGLAVAAGALAYFAAARLVGLQEGHEAWELFRHRLLGALRPA